MYFLPTRPPRRYRGKYPFRIHSWSYADSGSQRAIGAFLSIRRPVHIELNSGVRFICSIRELKAKDLKVGADFHEILVDQEPTFIELAQAQYDEMLALIRKVRSH